MPGTARLFLHAALTLVFLVLFARGPAMAQQAIAPQEYEVEKLLGQGDAYVKKGDFKLAMGSYLEASAISKSRMNLSRAYFGLSRCYFELRDRDDAMKYMRKVLEVDPNKEISELFYPKPFVALFNQVRKEVRPKGTVPEHITPPLPQKPVQQKQEQKAEEKKKAGEETKAGEEKKEAARPEQAAAKPPPEKLAPLEKLKIYQEERRGGHWEIGVHYSGWSFDFIKSIFEDAITEKIGEQIQNEIVKKSGTIQAGLVKLQYAQNLSINSQGDNYGLELRYYSKGRAGTFSLGLAFEKTNIKLLLKGRARQDFTNGGSAEVDTDATLEARPFSTHVNFRLDFGADVRVTPYIVFGAGLAPLDGTFSCTYNGTYKSGDIQEIIKDEKIQTFEELSEDIDFKIPDTLIIVQLIFGVKAELYKGLYLAGEVGVWDGVILRGGLAYRF
jgi:tetratricopeptide (TPR) repeat protein